MTITVIIISFRNPGDVLRCLEALSHQTERNFTIYICENGGADAAETLAPMLSRQLKNGPPVHLLIAPENLGYAGGINFSIENSPEADAYWILNPDTQPDPPTLAALAGCMQAEGHDAVGGIIYMDDDSIRTAGGIWHAWAARVTSIAMGVDKRAAPLPEDVVPKLDFISGASIFASRRFVKCAGPMRAEYFLYAEEVEWCVRAVKRGMTLGYAPGARVWHAQGSSTGSGKGPKTRPRLPIYLDERNKLLTVRDTSPAWLVTAIPISLIMLTMRYGRNGSASQWRYALQGWWAGVRNKRGKPSFLLP